MIKINLALRKQSALAADPGSGKGGADSVGKTGIINVEELKGLPFRRFVIPIAFAAAATFLVNDYKQDEIKKVDARLAKLEKEANQLQQNLAKTRTYDDMRKSLEADEFAIRKKLETVKKLVMDRSTPPKVLLTFSQLTPPEVWLSELVIRDVDVSVKGFSLGLTQISDFMKNLQESIYFKEVSLKGSQQGRSETGHEIATFELTAQRRME